MIWNVIDRRRRRYRWAKVHAIVEPTWHDNSVSGADQAPETTAETDVVFDERKEISVNDAITWATSQSCPVTLYVRDGEALDQSSNEEVDAAAPPSFDGSNPTRKADIRFIVEGVLRAAANVRGQNSAWVERVSGSGAKN